MYPGDLDGVDGLDLIIANQTPDTVSVLLNNGDGTHGRSTAYDSGDAWSVALGNLDGVNGLDLAVAGSSFADIVSVLLNNGDGTFAPAVAYDAGDGAVSVAVGELDGINGPDLAVANIGPFDNGCLCFLGGDVSVLLNNGDGTFAPAVSYSPGAGPRFVAVGELDGINGPDLAVALDVGDSIKVLLNNGDGTFAPSVAYAVGEAPQSIAIGDLDGLEHFLAVGR